MSLLLCFSKRGCYRGVHTERPLWLLYLVCDKLYCARAVSLGNTVREKIDREEKSERQKQRSTGVRVLLFLGDFSGE